MHSFFFALVILIFKITFFYLLPTFSIIIKNRLETAITILQQCFPLVSHAPLLLKNTISRVQCYQNENNLPRQDKNIVSTQRTIPLCMINLSTFTPHVQPEEAKTLLSSTLHPTITKRPSEIFQTSRDTYPR